MSATKIVSLLSAFLLITTATAHQIRDNDDDFTDIEELDENEFASRNMDQNDEVRR